MPSLRPFLRPIVVSASVCLSVSACLADELKLPNGDRITGTVIEQTNDSITFRSSILGEFTVPSQGLVVVKSGSEPETPVESLAGLPPSAPPEKTARKPGKAVAESSPNPDDSPAPWKGKLELGFRQQQGRRDAVNFDIRASANRQLDRDALSATARLLYGEQEEKIINDRYDGSFQWRRELGENTFAQTLSSFARDELKDIRQNWEQNVGAGIQLLESDGHLLNLGAGLTGQYRESADAESGFFALVELFQDYQYKINSHLTFIQNAVAQYSPDGQTRFMTVDNQPTAALPDATNYKVRFNSTLQGKLSQNLSLNLRFEYEFDNAVANKDARADQRITSSLGYGF